MKCLKYITMGLLSILASVVMAEETAPPSAPAVPQEESAVEPELFNEELDDAAKIKNAPGAPPPSPSEPAVNKVTEAIKAEKNNAKIKKIREKKLDKKAKKQLNKKIKKAKATKKKASY